MKKNMIEKYYVDGNGQPKVVMNQNTAHDVKIALDFYEEAIEKSSFSEAAQTRLTAMAIAERFLPQETMIGSYGIFLYAVKKKSNELLGIKEA